MQFSTVSVYGNTEYIGSKTLPNPVNHYGESKLRADMALLELADENFVVSVVRPAVVYGKNAPGNVTSLIKLIKAGLPLPFGYYKNRRSMIYVENLANLISKIILKKSDGIYLARDEKMPSIGEISETIRKEAGTKNLFFSLPDPFIGYLMKRKNLPFHKLFGDLVIDDSQTQKKIGKYQKYLLKKR